MSAIGLLGRSERLLMQRYGILARLRKQFTMPDATFEDLASYLNLIEDPDMLDELTVALDKVESGAEATTLIVETARQCQRRREERTPEKLGDTVRFDPRGRRNLYQSIVNEVSQMTATQRSLGTLSRRLRQTELFIQQACAILAYLDQDSLMEQAVSVGRKLLAADVGVTILLNVHGEIDAFWPQGVKKPGETFPEGMRFLLKPIETGEILLIQDLQHYPEAGSLPPEHLNIQRVLSAPLIIGRNPVGVLALGRTTYAPIFDAEDLRLLETFAKQISVALENARLHDAVLELAQLQERQRIAQDLHDSVVQLLFTMGMEAENILNELPADSPLRHRIQRIRRLISRSSTELRGAIGALTRGPNRKDEPLSVLLQELVKEFEELSHIEVTLLMPSRWPNLPDFSVQAIYRIVREALANIQKHAHATAVIVNVTVYLDRLIISIQDDGVGFQSDTTAYKYSDLHFGLRTMHQLAERAGGYLEAFNHEDGGAVIRFTLPLLPNRDGER